MNNGNIIEISNLYKSFSDVKAVQDVSFSVKAGELFAFLGVNGAGKSTTINIMCGQLSKDSGSIIIDGKNIDKDLPKNALQVDNVEYYEMEVPPIVFENCSFDAVVSFQVIEHIEKDMELVREVARVLRPGGKFIVSTPNAPMSLTRNPWHVREYNADELRNLLSCHFSKVEAYGVVGNDKVMEYYLKNRASVRKITRFDIFNLQHRLPRKILQIPYDILNRLNRRNLHKKNTALTESITMEDYSIVPYEPGLQCFDLFFVVTK